MILHDTENRLKLINYMSFYSKGFTFSDHLFITFLIVNIDMENTLKLHVCYKLNRHNYTNTVLQLYYSHVCRITCEFQVLKLLQLHKFNKTMHSECKGFVRCSPQYCHNMRNSNDINSKQVLTF